jgi:hypothetical protein
LKQIFKQRELVVPNEGNGPMVSRTVKKMRTTIKAPIGIALGIVLVLSEEKEGRQAKLLHVHPYENVLDRFGEEQTTSLAGR